jgi:ribonuclease P protein component
MDKSENKNSDTDSGKNKINYKLGKSDILRGHNSFSEHLKNSVSVSTVYLKVFVNTGKINISDSSDSLKSPLLTKKVKVGFIVAKKKIKKAVYRNRIKRLLRESYRLNRHYFEDLNGVDLIFTFSESGYLYFQKNPGMKLDILHNDLSKIALKIKNLISEK